ncbi:MAG: sulfatase-like hydrolase/transferase [Planctomycetota bacterium]|jgi:hypothetical protein
MVIKDFLAVLLVATLFHIGPITMYSDVVNRYLGGWNLLHVHALLISVFLFALLGVGIAGSTRLINKKWLTRCIANFFLIVCVIAASSYWTSLAGTKPRLLNFPQMAILLTIGIAGVEIGRKSTLLAKIVHSGCVIMSPLAFILLVQLCTWNRFDFEYSGKTPESAAVQTPVFIFLFDGWSFAHSFDLEKSRFRPDLENLNTLASQLTVFTNARSPATFTHLFVPMFLHQQRGNIKIRDGGMDFIPDEQNSDGGEQATLFSAFQQLGYANHLVGCYLPYPSLINYRAVNIKSFLNTGANLVQRIKHINAYNTAHFWQDPVSQHLGRRIFNNVFSHRFHEQYQNITRETLVIISESSSNTFLFSHNNIPHGPFVVRSDGSFAKAFENNRWDGNLIEYREHLKLLDRTFQSYIDAIKARGLYDEALIIAMSDHGWRSDPNLAKDQNEEYVQRVPLLIKFPQQTTGKIIDERTELVQLSKLINPHVPILKQGKLVHPRDFESPAAEAITSR